ncbi:DinB family protein [Flavobacterium difficile]|uniref:DinB family protein n=1 Tax=Flavobacterium difficile TaxID=2709659 RepID=A0ABX0I8R9_9FLAO|nr:DinB family protein [Flavobacterium difficile]NHM02608.1 DinB family protein [Flavobacterium difficile]
METTFKIWKTNRALYLNFLEKYSLEQLNQIPNGMRNNLIWNIGHAVVSQQGLVYRLSGLPMQISTEMMETYKNGSVPSGATTLEEVNEIKNLLTSTVNQTISDFENDVFKTYTPYQTSTGFSLQNLNDALQFNNYHEAIHLGFMMKIKNFI